MYPRQSFAFHYVAQAILGFLSVGIISMSYPSQSIIQSTANIKEARFQQEERMSFKVLVYICWQGRGEVRAS